MADDRRSPPPGAAPRDDAIEQILRLAGPRDQANPARVARVRAATHAAWRDTAAARAGRRWFAWGGLALAAAGAVLILVMTRPQAPRPSPPSRVAGRVISATGELLLAADRPLRLAPPATIAAGSRLRTASDALAAVALDRGGELRLGANTSLTLVEPRRIALEAGAVYYDSGRRSPDGDAFAIETPRGTVRDIGTRFEVRVDGTTVRIRVRDGTVRLDGEGSRHDAPAGIELHATAAGGVSRRAIATFGDDWNWTVRAAAPFRLEGRTLGVFLDWIAREGGRDVAFRNPAIEPAARRIVVHGSIDGLTPDEALAAIVPACGLTYTIDGGRVVLDRSGSARE
jgi:ferric-dicitrate binding protein FerR (iron transport regulator)